MGAQAKATAEMGLRDLFRPKWKHSNGRVRVAAVKTLTDEAVLTELVRTDADWSVRRAAVKKLTDQAMLTELAKTNEDPCVRWAASKALTDQALLADSAVQKKTGHEVVGKKGDRAAVNIAGSENEAPTTAAGDQGVRERPKKAPYRTGADQVRETEPVKANTETEGKRIHPSKRSHLASRVS